MKPSLTRAAEQTLDAQQKFPKVENIQNHQKSNTKNALRKQQKNSLKNLRHFLGKIFFPINSDKVYKNGYWVL